MPCLYLVLTAGSLVRSPPSAVLGLVPTRWPSRKRRRSLAPDRMGVVEYGNERVWFSTVTETETVSGPSLTGGLIVTLGCTRFKLASSGNLSKGSLASTR